MDWTTVLVAAIASAGTLVAASQNTWFAHRVYRRQRIEELRFEREAKEREAIYQLFELLAEYERAARSYRRRAPSHGLDTTDASHDESHDQLYRAFASLRPHEALLRSGSTHRAVSLAIAGTYQVTVYGEAKSDWAKEAVGAAKQRSPELHPVSTLMTMAHESLAARLDELYPPDPTAEQETSA